MMKKESLKNLAEKAENELREKRILGGMDLFHLKKENYVVFSMDDYNKLIASLEKQN